MLINTDMLDYKELNQRLREANADCVVTGCLGQRFIAAGFSKNVFDIEGIPGNALGAYLNGAQIIIHGNAQDAVGDTMNDGRIVIRGSVGDAVGYAMRGGEIYVKGNAGYRAGIHMKEYKEKKPVMVIGGSAGSFLGEYQAGGLIVVLGINRGERPIVGNFPCTGMHGGNVFLRCAPEELKALPKQVNAKLATDEDMSMVAQVIRNYCGLFDVDFDEVMSGKFTVISPDSRNPYRQMYVTAAS